MISSGLYVPNKFNLAIHPQTTTFSVWAFDVNYSNTTDNFFIYLVDDFFAGYDPNQENILWSSIRNNGTIFKINQLHIEIININGSLERHLVTFPINDAQLISDGVWLHYDIVRTEIKFLVYINQQLIDETELISNRMVQYGHFGLAVNQGSNKKFDNLKISPDYEEFLANLNPSKSETYFLSKYLGLLG